MNWNDRRLEKELDQFLSLLEQMDVQETIGIFKLMGIEFRKDPTSTPPVQEDLDGADTKEIHQDLLADGETLYVRAIQKYPTLSRKAKKNLLYVMREAAKENKIKEGD